VRSAIGEQKPLELLTRVWALIRLCLLVGCVLLSALGSAHGQGVGALQARSGPAPAAATINTANTAATSTPGRAAIDGPSVYRVSLAADLPVTAAAGLAILLPYVLADRLITPRCPCDRDEVDRFDRGAIGNSSALAGRVSDVTAGAVMVLPVLLDALDLGFQHALFEDALVFTEALAINGALVTGAKYLVQRPLPRTYAGDTALLHSPGGYRSFYSGHTSLVFAALSATSMTLRLRYGEQFWPWLGTLLVGSSVGLERVADGRHFRSDVMVGALMGMLVGIGVPWLHARPERRAQGLFAAPVPGGLWLGWRRTL
jgi:membrane-associated phospholipid phosphatase